MNNQLHSDIEYLKDMAEAGEDAPSLSGRFATLWFGLLTVTLMGHWVIARGLIPGVGEAYIGLLWLAFGVVGGLGSVLISKSLRDMPGQSAAKNRVDRVTWKVAAIGLFGYAIAISLAVTFRHDMGPLLFDTIMPTAFLVYGVSYAGTAAFTKGFSKWLPVIVSLAFSAITVIMVGMVDIYLAASVGVVAVWSLGGFGQLRNEPKPTV